MDGSYTRSNSNVHHNVYVDGITMICENCGANIKILYEVKRMRLICFGTIAFRFGTKYIENVCANCINQSVVLFIDKKHSVNIEMFNIVSFNKRDSIGWEKKP